MMVLRFISRKPETSDSYRIDESRIEEDQIAEHGTDEGQEPGHPVLRALSLASLVIGATALGLYLGRELRQRYKFNRRTPYDFYSKAGDPVTMTEYGMGV